MGLFMKKLRLLLILAALSFTSANLFAQEFNFGIKKSWRKKKATLKPAEEGFEYNCIKNFSEINASFSEIKLDANEQIVFSFKIKGSGEVKPDAAGFRFGIYGKNGEGKLYGYTVTCATMGKRCAMSHKTPDAPRMLSGKGFRTIRNAKSGNINSEEFTEFKLVITNLSNNESEFKLYINSALTIKCKRANMPSDAFSMIALGTGAKVNNFIIKDIKVSKKKQEQ